MRTIAALVPLLLCACGGSDDAGPARPSATPPEPARSGPSATSAPEVDPVPEPEAEPEPPSTVSDGRPRDALLSIPRLGLRDLAVIAYRGFTDDAPGTKLQNEGHAASPHGPRGGVGPGDIGNYQVTAHRTSSTRAFEFLPELRPGARVVVRAGGVEYVYRITATRETSFRSPRSLREQRAAVPGRPGREPSKAMITLSTCGTTEDHAEGNYWADQLDNPEHRIDKIGVLVATRDPW
jgi:sortase A